MLGRAREALKPTNAIEAARPRRGSDIPTGSQAVAPSAGGTGPVVRVGGSPTAQAAGTDAQAPDPDAVRRRFYTQNRGGERRYYDDYRGEALAFRADAKQISSKREDLNTIRAMLDIAQARGWQDVTVRGTSAFRREAWIEATARNLSAQGHRATDLDRQEAERRRAQRGPAQAGPARAEAERSTLPTASGSPPQAAIQAATPDAGKAAPGQAPPRSGGRDAGTPLSSDARLVLEAIEVKIDATMRRLTAEAKAELKAYAAAELGAKERRQGLIVLTPEQRQAAAAPALNHGAEAPSRRSETAREGVATPRPPEAPEPRLARRR